MSGICPVCGYPTPAATHEICRSCGFQFGVTDGDRGICYEEWRNHWVARGMPWQGLSRKPPDGWNPTEQLQSLTRQTPSVSGISLSDAARGALWIGAPPRVRNEPSLIAAVSDDLLMLLRACDMHPIETDEPRKYRDTPIGRDALFEALSSGSIARVSMRDIARRNWKEMGISRGYASMQMDDSRPVEHAAHIGCYILPPTPEAIPQVMIQLTAFVERWFIPLHAASAAVHPGLLSITQREREHGQLTEWSAVRRYIRGVFWGNALGPDLCDRLGGQGRILREAPVAIARPLGDGVWLQLSSTLDVTPDAVVRLADYLSPLLHWTLRDVQTQSRPWRSFYPGYAPASQSPSPVSYPTTGEDDAGAEVPMEMLDETLTHFDMGLNIYLSAPPTAEQREKMEAVIYRWFHDGRAGLFDPYDVSSIMWRKLRGPSTVGSVMRWYINHGMKYPDPYNREQALKPLRQRLAALHTVPVEKIVVGTETVG